MSVVKAERYAEYSGSGFEWMGRLPSSWRTLRLKNVIEKLESGVSVNASDEPVTGNNIGVLKTSCVGKDCLISDENKSVWPTELDRVSTPVRAGRIIVSRMNTPQLVGASAYVPKDYPNLFLPDRLWQTVFYSSVKLDSKWLSLLIGCKDFRYLLSTVATGTSPSMKNLGQDKFLSISIPFPSLEEQTAIAAYLDTKTAQIDRQIDLLSQKATQYGKLKQSLINETVTRGLDKTVPMKDSGVEWIGEIPMHWEMKPIRNLLENRLDKNVGNIEGEYLSLVAGIGVIPYAEKGNVGNKKPEDLEKCKMVFEGDFVLNSMNFGIGSFGISRYNGVCSSVYIVMRPKRISNGEFLHRIFQIKPFQKLMSSYGKGIMEIRMAIKWEHLKTIEIPCPPLIEQQAIAKYLDEKTAQIDRIVPLINTQIDMLKDLRKALINDVVTGKIKVVSDGEAA